LKNILLLSPHTDDIELGCGGTVFKLLENGANLFWVVFSTAEISIPKEYSKDTLKNEFQDVMNTIGLGKDSYKIFTFKVRELHVHRQPILDELIKIRDMFKPDLVICPSLNDFHQDHQVIASETVRAFKTSSSIISYELPWNYITFNTQLFSKLTKSHMDRKWDILQKYKSQSNKRYFDKDAIYGLAKARGVQCDSDYAEAFEVIRWII
jgi:LmbE family N-acetylglucosaminyl deacetylase